MEGQTITQRLELAASSEFTSVTSWLDQLPSPERVALLIDLCREIDCWAVEYAFSDDEQITHFQTFDMLLRGWNDALALLLPSGRGIKGFPLGASTDNTRCLARTLLHQLGRSSLLSQAVAMLRHGIFEGTLRDNAIVLRMTDRAATYHFLDQMEASKLKEVEERHDIPRAHPFQQFLLSDLEARIKPLVFPWESTKGTMIGYDAEPDLDQHFLAVVSEKIVEWRNEAGLHPQAHLNGVSMADVLAISGLLISMHIKHINFVHVGMKAVPNANYPMSLTIWKTEPELCTSLADFTGINEAIVSAALDHIVVRPEHSKCFRNEPTTYLPLLIEITDGYFLLPVSSIFKNPFYGIRMLHEKTSGGTLDAIREPREAWMQEELYALFQGNRYERVPGTIKLRQRAGTATDIDAAIFDWTSGELAIFQLKWQDFATGEIRQQRSKAKNFVERVDKWTAAVRSWIDVEGLDALRKALRIKAASSIPITDIRLFAVGRSAARFRSYGYTLQHTETAVAIWPQFIRARFEVGPVADVILALHDRLRREGEQPVKRKAIPHEVVAAGQQVIFEDLWSTAEDEQGNGPDPVA